VSVLALTAPEIGPALNSATLADRRSCQLRLTIPGEFIVGSGTDVSDHVFEDRSADVSNGFDRSFKSYEPQ
jgi:hypothetical protein